MISAMSRELTTTERTILEALIAHGDPGSDRARVSSADRERWAATVPDITMCGECGCGLCPSVELAHRGVPVDHERGPRIVLSADAPGSMVLLFIDGDLPSYLEFVPLDDDPVKMPDPAALVFTD